MAEPPAQIQNRTPSSLLPRWRTSPPASPMAAAPPPPQAGAHPHQQQQQGQAALSSPAKTSRTPLPPLFLQQRRNCSSVHEQQHAATSPCSSSRCSSSSSRCWLLRQVRPAGPPSPVRSPCQATAGRPLCRPPSRSAPIAARQQHGTTTIAQISAHGSERATSSPDPHQPIVGDRHGDLLQCLGHPPVQSDGEERHHSDRDSDSSDDAHSRSRFRPAAQAAGERRF